MKPKKALLQPIHTLNATKPLTLRHVNEALMRSDGAERVAIATLAFSGIRAMECLCLRKSDIDSESGWISFGSRPGAELVGQTNWKVPIHPRLSGILETLPLPSAEVAFSRQITTRRGVETVIPLTQPTLRAKFDKILQRAGLADIPGKPRFPLYSLRQFFEASCLSAGVPRRVIESWLGRSHLDPRLPPTMDDESQFWIRKVQF